MYRYGLAYDENAHRIEFRCRDTYSIPEREYSPKSLTDFLNRTLHLSNIEQDMIVSLNAKRTPSGFYLSQRGNQVYGLFDLRLVALYSLLSFRDMFVYVHHNPVACISPSEDDDAMCKKLLAVYESLSASLVDFLLVNGSSFYSYMESGRLSYLSDLSDTTNDGAFHPDGIAVTGAFNGNARVA